MTAGNAVLTVPGIPDSIIHRAILETAAELYYRRNMRGGSGQFTPTSGGRIAGDPMKAGMLIIGPWLPPGVA